VTGASVVCPDAPVTAGATGSGVGTLRARALRGAAGPVALSGAGAVVPEVPGVVLAARGAVAAGLAAEHVRRVDDRALRGLTAVRCTAPGTSAWFVGGSTVVGDTAELVLVNAEDAPAVVDVGAWSSDGPVDPRPGPRHPRAGADAAGRTAGPARARPGVAGAARHRVPGTGRTVRPAQPRRRPQSAWGRLGRSGPAARAGRWSSQDSRPGPAAAASSSPTRARTTRPPASSSPPATASSSRWSWPSLPGRRWCAR
jgi:hypothetical protein